MKRRKNPRLILVVSLIIGLSIAVIGLLVYEFITTKKVESDSVFKALIILAGGALTLGKIYTKNHIKRTPDVYRNLYKDLIGDAFTDGSKQSKTFFRALDFYNDDAYSKALELLGSIPKEDLPGKERFVLSVFTALCYDDMRQYVRAAEEYEKAWSLRENSTVASNLGLCYQHLGQDEKSIAAYENAISINPDNAYPYNNLAQLYIRREEYEQALEYAVKATALRSNFHQAYSAQAVCHAMLGEKELYEKALRRAVANGSDKESIEEYVRSLGAEI